MGMWVFDDLLPTLARAFAERVLWDDGEGGGGTIIGRFRTDTQEVALGGIEPGLGTTQTWFYCDRKMVPGRLPELGDYLVIRGETWEIAQFDGADDLGELAFRLIKRAIGSPPFLPEPDDLDTRQAPGRPSRRAEILAAYDAAKEAGKIDDGPHSLGEVVRIVRDYIRPCDERGLGDKTLRRVLAPRVAPRVAARGGRLGG